jgi:hypothetical protein
MASCVRCLLAAIALGFLAFTNMALSNRPWIQQTGSESADPWAPDRLMQTEDLSRILSDPATRKPLVLHIGIQYLYRNAHIAGSRFVGTASLPEGIEKLKDEVRNIPQDSEIVLYCGCCPWDVCPNPRPAYKALMDLGYKNVKVLYLPQNLQRDWVQKGFPTEKRAAPANGNQD